MPDQPTDLHKRYAHIAIGAGLAALLVVSQIALSILPQTSVGLLTGLAILNTMPFIIVFTLMMKRIRKADDFDNLVI